ncbi:MAG: ATP-binding protein, partial [Clostridia bacterium]|nr:ATP-binding protein [Clostridia bacterium]
SLDRIINYILVGGWPAAIGMNEKQGILLSKEYLKTVLNEDIYKVDNIKRYSHKVELLLRSLARNESTTVTNRTL